MASTDDLRGTDFGIAIALGAAVLFGASTPLAKLLTGDIHPVMLAALLYLGSGVGLLGAYLLYRAVGGSTARAETALGAGDMPWLVGSVLFGGVLGPVLLMVGLTLTPAATASLLLNLEAALTTLLAWLVFREHVDRRIAAGMGLIVLGSVILSWEGRPDLAVPWGPLAVANACLAWAIDNNLTRRVSEKDPVQVAGIKGLAAGLVNLGLALGVGAAWPQPLATLSAAGVGLFGYGMSLVLFVLALRHLGTARTGAYFSSAPFIGAALALVLLREVPGAGFWAAVVLMGAGLWLHLTERHGHVHGHEALTHGHRHAHDEHHQHAHDFPWDGREPHAHVHVHDPLNHDHPHYPDTHHRHGHD